MKIRTGLSTLFYRAFVLVFATALVSGCLKTRTDLEEAEAEQEMVSNVNRLQRSAADQELKFQDIDTEFRNLSGRIEALERKGQLESADQAENKKTLEQRISKLEELTQLLQEALEQQSQELAILKKRSSQKPKAVKKKRKKGNYAGAEQAFKEKKWRDAILGYEKYLELNPKGNVADLATYKIGVSFQELKLFDEARTFYQLAIDKYPKSEGAKRSRYRLKNMK